MFKNCNVLKKMSSILMSVIVCVTPVMSGYAAESFENSGADEIRGGVLKPLMLDMVRIV